MYNHKHIMSPGGGTVLVQNFDHNMYRRVDDRQILSGVVDGRSRGFHNLANYHDHYCQN